VLRARLVSKLYLLASIWLAPVYLHFKVGRFKSNKATVQKNLHIFLTEAPTIFALGHIICAMTIMIAPMLSKPFVSFTRLNKAKQENFLSQLASGNLRILKLPYQAVSTLGAILCDHMVKDNTTSDKSKPPENAYASPASISDVPDFIVIGSGAGGAAAALTLQEAGKKTLIIEEGQIFDPKKTEEDIFSAMRHIWRDFGMQVGKGQTIFPILQGKCVGGSTVVSGSILHRLPKSVWKSWWLGERATADRFQFEEIERCEEEIIQLISPKASSIEFYNTTPVFKLLEASGFQPATMLRSDIGCEKSENCLIGCRTGGKGSVDKTLLSKFTELGGRMLVGCSVIRIEENSNESFVWIKSKSFGIKQLRAKQIVLAAGVIHSAVILRKSGVKSDALGRNFSCNLSHAISVEYESPKIKYEGPPMGIEAHLRPGVKISTQSAPLSLTAPRLGLPINELQKLNSTNFSSWAISIKSSAAGTINFGATRKLFKVHLSPSERDFAKMYEATLELTSLFYKNFRCRIFPQLSSGPKIVEDNNSFKKLMCHTLAPKDFNFGASHLFGGCRFGHNPKQNVADGYGRLHSYNRVHIVDASLFPTSTGLNPQLAIMAISRAICKRLCK